jgi:hypothetical protein
VTGNSEVGFQNVTSVSYTTTVAVRPIPAE